MGTGKLIDEHGDHLDGKRDKNEFGPGLARPLTFLTVLNLFSD